MFETTSKEYLILHNEMARVVEESKQDQTPEQQIATIFVFRELLDRLEKHNA